MRTKDDIEFHYERDRKPAVNVKVRKSLADGYREFVMANEVDARFTEEWLEEVGQDSLESAWYFAIESAWEQLEEDTKEIYGKHVRVYSEGRQGGWAYIDGISWDTESWDAIEFSRWKRFAKVARSYADDIMYQMVDLIYHNKFEAWKDEQSEQFAPDIERTISSL